MTLPTGDPASVSALGGALLTQSARLADLVTELGGSAARAARASQARRRPVDDVSSHERLLLERAATELDRVGALLQAWTTTSVETAARARQLAPDLARADLVIDGQVVVESSGPSRVDPQTRARERQRLQELLNRVTMVRARELARLGRELQHSHDALAAVALDARAGRSATS
ncbi:hypothetical protein FHX52_0035 [Humibacillus xanthopallidus]|uniref:Uncharacterized protein n=1 Tax=Humibacillus xanthopallidus TaxID=412689 RepID=A0A543PS89_9MICO|nr:hypothetical protein [Humibacillus xanthopallidus]TQN46946.1 hypothetical protein FHX52_0035 [Humibacillus xanthopallidus]